MAVADGAAGAARLIETMRDVEDGVRWLRRRCAVMRLAHDTAGMPPLRRTRGGFEGLARIIVAQQLSVASADAIWSRMTAAVRPFRALVLRAASDAELRACGLSRGKVVTLRALSEAVATRRLDLRRLKAAPDEEIHARLTEVHGIGPWTADIFLMFCLGRADAFAPGDLALQEALRRAREADVRPTAAEIAEFAETWRPWRGVAARLLWNYYRVATERRSGIPV